MCDRIQLILDHTVVVWPRHRHGPEGRQGFLGGSVVRNPSANAGDVGLIPESRRGPREGNGSPLQYSCLGNPIDRTWQAILHGVAEESDTT